MHPILFELPWIGFPIRSFGVMLALGFLVGSWVLHRLALRHSRDPEREAPRYASIPVWVLVGVVLGARLMYVVVEIARGSPTGERYLDEPWTIFAVWEGGLVMYGGLFGGIVAGWWCAKRHELAPREAADLGLTAGFFGQAVGRVGCLLVGDDYGSVVPEKYAHLPFPITLRVPDPLPEHSLFGVENAGKLLWATQVWMSLNALLLALLGLWLLRRRRYAGQVALAIVFVYSITRFAIESFRGDQVRGTWFEGAISTSQIISIATGLVALALLIRSRGARESLAETRR